MNEIIAQRAAKHFYYLNIAAAFIWPTWIIFDYIFAPEHLLPFLFTRILGSLISIALIANHHKKWIPVFAAQIIMFGVYNAILAFYLIVINQNALSPYFNGYMMVMIVMYLILVIRYFDILFFSLIALSAFVTILLFSAHEGTVILGQGGFSFLTVTMLLIVFATLRYRGILRDVSLVAEIDKARETEELNKTLQIANKEKETLLQEIHHRVKNNLQLVSSILNLQKSFFDDERIKSIIQDSQQRVASMSRIHQTLYRSKNFSSINMSDYLKDLSHEIIELYNDTLTPSIHLKFDTETVYFTIQEAIPVGLLANEIITNAVKHAFPNNSKGTISIFLKKIDDTVFLQISDDGIGLSQKSKAAESTSLGKELIQALSEQIEATIETSSVTGLSYVIRIPHSDNDNINL
jgi:two-component sensor histidine kinase